MKDRTPEEKKDILTQLYNLMRADENEAFEFISRVIHQGGEIKNKLSTILNLFYIYYRRANNAFTDNPVFNILDLYYELFLPYGKLDKNARKAYQLNDKEKNQLLLSLEDLPSNIILLLNKAILDGVFFSLTSFEKDLTAYREDAAKIETSVQAEVQKLGLSRFSGTFDKIAKQERCAKIVWMIAAFFSACGAAYFILESSFAIIAQDFNIPLVEFLQKLTNTLFFCFVAYWFAKRYYVCRTQEIIYRHTAVALNTYSTFIRATDKEERGIVAGEMAHTIFAPPLLPSMKAVDNSDWPKIVEVLRLVLDREGRTTAKES